MGRTSQQHAPSWLAGTPGFSENNVSVYGVQLAWSDNHQFSFEVASDGTRFIQVGELLSPGEVCLEPGESYHAPALYGAFSAAGIGGIIQIFHAYIRTNFLNWPRIKPRPVLLNTWEGIYFNHQPDYLKKMASKAAALGKERFVLDDGWFKGRNSECTALGDWYLDESKYPDGLQPVNLSYIMFPIIDESLETSPSTDSQEARQLIRKESRCTSGRYRYTLCKYMILYENILSH